MASKVRVIPNCVSPHIHTTQKQFNIANPVILQIGTKENKNLPRLIQALQGIKCTINIVGNLNVLQMKLLHDYNISFNNYMNLAYEQIVRLYQECDIVTLISTYEGFGLPIIEANATGRVVIAANIASIPEVAGNAALLVDPYNVAEIRDGILSLISNENLRNNLIYNGLENIKRFQPITIAAQYENLYRTIISESK